jgi:SH3 domain-containing YSC84-like protein 1
MKVEILSYSRAQGVFAGVNLSGGVVRSDNDDNEDLYGAGVSPRDVVMSGTVQPLPVTEPFMAELNRVK